jgi:hypothetical protein
MQRREFLGSTAQAGAMVALGGLGTELTIGSPTLSAGASEPGRYPFGLSQAQEEQAETQLGPLYAEMGFRPEDGIVGKQETLIGYEDGRDMPNITRGLVKRGYNDDQIKGILGENFLRVFEQVCG